MTTLRQRNTAATAVPEVDLTAGGADDSNLIEFAPPTFTVKDLLGAIPKQCFERSALHSSLYVLQDLVFIAAFIYGAKHIDSAFGKNGEVLQGYTGVAAKWAAWGVYWFMQGMAMTGIWVLAHECGHQAFSPSKTINNAVGLVLHSALLVPYHSWRISHARHHAATGHLNRDEVHVPRTRSQRTKGRTPKKVVKEGIEMEELLEDTPLFRLGMLIGQQLFGWPLYLILNVSSHIDPVKRPGWINHFDPNSRLFDARHKPLIVLSDIALVVAAGLIKVLSDYIGWSGVVKYYFIPYLMVNHWLVMITFLQHTDPTLAYYRAPEWNFARGALCTFDRTLMGPCGAIFFHGITETHVSHHISSKIPHYNAWEATEALKQLLGPHYKSTDENMFVSLWKNYRTCRFVEDEGNVVFFKDANGRSQMRLGSDGTSDSGVDVEEVEADC